MARAEQAFQLPVTAEVVTNSQSSTSKAQRKVGLLHAVRGSSALDYVFMVIATAASVANGACMPLFALTFGTFVDALKDMDVMPKAKAAAGNLALLAAGVMVAFYLQAFLWMWTGAKSSNRLRHQYLDAVLNQDILYFDTQTSTGKMMRGLQEDCSSVQRAISESMGGFIQRTTTFVVGFVVAFYQGWDMTLVLLACLPFLAAVGAALAKMTGRMESKAAVAYAAAGDIAQQCLQQLRIVLSYGQQERLQDVYQFALAMTTKVGTQQGLVNGLCLGSLNLVLFAAYAGSLYYGGVRIAAGHMTAGRVLAVMMSALLGSFSLGQAAPLIQDILQGQAAMQSLFEVIQRRPAIDSKKGGLQLRGVEGRLELKQVFFAYPSAQDQPVLQNFSVAVPAGSTLALVGPSGSGKSTVVALLQRFYDPSAGCVLLDGRDIRAYDLAWLRSQMALVSQEPVLFAASIEENISMGRPSASLEEVHRAAAAANIHSMVAALPNGYNTYLGDKGLGLSGGQKQRIAIARAILKNPKILLLDEATSALDSASEAAVIAALEDLTSAHERTCVVVAHRLSTVQGADIIAVVDKGVIVEQGSHAQLLAKKTGAYARLLQLQQAEQKQQQHERPRLVDKNGVPRWHVLEGHVSSGGLRKRNSSGTGDWSPTKSDVSSSTAATASSAFHSSANLLEMPPSPIKSDDSHKTADLDAELDVQHYSTAAAFGRLAKMNAREAHLGVLGVVGSIGHGLITPGFALVLALMIGSFISADPASLMTEIRKYSGVLAGIGGWSLVMITLQMWCLAAMGCRLATRVRIQLMGALMRQEIGWHDLPHHSPAQMCLLLSRDAGCMRGAVGDLCGMLAQTLGSLVLGFGVAFASDWRMALVVTGALPLLLLGAIILTKDAVGGGTTQNKAYLAATQTISEALSAIRTIHSYNLQPWVSQLFTDLLHQQNKAVLRNCHLSGLGLGYAQAILFALMALVVWFGGLEVSSGRATITEVMRGFLCVVFAALGMAQAQVSFPELPRAKAAAKRILSLLDRRSPIEGSSGGGVVVEKQELLGAVEFRGVRFEYPARPGVAVLQGLSVKCSAGSTLALVGPSGSGKSTVVALLQRFYDPSAGCVLLDGRDLRTYDLAWLRQQMALVSQDSLMFVGTIRDNIAFGRMDADLDEVMAAAQAAHAHSFIMQLPMGYDTPLGIQGAVQLSGGQKQRLSIARAILCNPRILLLDEPTSALDASSEAAVSAALADLANSSSSSRSQRTTIVVAHRLSTVRDADVIAVVVDGRVVEQGTHQALLTDSGSSFYAELVATQQGNHS